MSEIDETPYDVVAVGAHPDDVEIACGAVSYTHLTLPTILRV